MAIVKIGNSVAEYKLREGADAEKFAKSIGGKVISARQAERHEASLKAKRDTEDKERDVVKDRILKFEVMRIEKLVELGVVSKSAIGVALRGVEGSVRKRAADYFGVEIVA